jgi:glycosyltransferase involved in cell wall biosynthesis
MPSLHVALITRRFWPLVGGPERLMATLAEELPELGARTTVVTTQWDTNWPEATDHSGTPVIRLPYSLLPGWGTIRSMWSLGRWLRSQTDPVDAVVVSTLRHDAFAASGALRGTPVPVLLRAERAGRWGDTLWQQEARFGSRIRRSCQQADAIVVPHESVAAELHAAGYAPAQLHLIPNGVKLPAPRTPPRRRLARATLAEANPDFRTADETPIAVYVGRLHTTQGLHDLIRAWRKVIDLWPQARLWLVGEGTDRGDLYDRLRDHELKYHVSMPGAFDDVTELLQAADVFVQPAYEANTRLALLEAMAAGVPVIAADVPEHRQLLGSHERGLLVPIRSPTLLAEAIAQVFTLQQEAVQRAAAARNHVAERYSARRMAAQHLQLIEQCIAARKAQ